MPKKKKDDIIIIDDKEYNVTELSDEVKAEIQSLQFAQTEFDRLNAKLAITMTAINAYKRAIKELLSQEDE